jgi:hypothetical protein
MSDNPELPKSKLTTTSPERERFFAWPGTRLGRLAVGLTVAGWLLPLATIFINVLLTSLSNGEPQGINAFNTLVLLCEIAGGILGAIAVWKKHERSVVVWLVILIGAAAVVVVLWDFIKAL